MNVRAFQRFLSLCGLIGRAPANTADTTVGAATLSAAAFVNGYITRSGSTAAYTDTTPTITLLGAALPGGQLEIGLSWELQIRNNTSFIETLSAGTGGTLSGITVIPPYSVLTALVTITSSTTYTMVGFSLSPVLTNFAEVVTATNVIAASENGATFYLNAAAGFQSTLPAPAMGLQFEFIVQLVATSNGYTIVPASGTILFGSGQSGQGGASGQTTGSTGEGTITLVANQAAIGDRVSFKSDGTNWYFWASVALDAGLTCA